jgi:mono/diheme cytochrome c family protein
VTQLVTFIRNWEPQAPDRLAVAEEGDPSKGLVIFNSTCIICHGENGHGTERAPALNDPVKLAQFDDKWYADTIAAGRPAQGMPTWGTVLSPLQIRNLVALLRAWQRGETVSLPGP